MPAKIKVLKRQISEVEKTYRKTTFTEVVGTIKHKEPDKPKEKKKNRSFNAMKCFGRIPKWMIISYKTRAKQTWNLVPMVLSTYNALIIPIEMSFGLPYEFLQLNTYIDIIVDLLFVLDNILVFFTSYQDRRGLEVKDHYLIYLNYTRTW